MTRPTYLISLVSLLFTLSAQGLVIDPLAPHAPSSTPSSLPVRSLPSHKRADGPPLMKSRQEWVPNPEWPPNTPNNGSIPNNSSIPDNGIPNPNNTNPNSPNPNKPGHGDNSSGFPRSGPCSDEGLWVCNGDSFQRCASGSWSAVVHVAAGTECSPDGQTDGFQIGYDNSYNDTDGDNDNRGNSSSSHRNHRNGTSLNAAASDFAEANLAISVLADGRATAALMLGAWALVLPMVLG